MLHSFLPHDFADRFRHVKYMKACLSGQAITQSAKDIPHVVDHRYFYDEFDPTSAVFVAHYTWGLLAMLYINNRV